jgi:hypothetical protein
MFGYTETRQHGAPRERGRVVLGLVGSRRQVPFGRVLLGAAVALFFALFVYLLTPVPFIMSDPIPLRAGLGGLRWGGVGWVVVWDGAGCVGMNQ